MENRVLVGVVTFDGKAYATDNFLNALERLEGSFDVLFVDNSETDDYKKVLESKGFEVHKISHEGTRIDRIIRGRNMIRQAFLERGYAHLFFLDSDTIAPSNVLSKLLSHDKNIVSGAYLGLREHMGRTVPFPVLVVPKDDGKLRNLTPMDVSGDDLIEVAIAGFGCMLIKRGVLENIRIRNYGSGEGGGEDVAFCMDAKKNGYIVYADTGVKCFHMIFPEGDKRNEWLRFDKRNPWLKSIFK